MKSLILTIIASLAILVASNPMTRPIPDNGEVASAGNDNEFSGTGFMFAINSMVVDNSLVKMFNQNSDNVEKIEPVPSH